MAAGGSPSPLYALLERKESITGTAVLAAVQEAYATARGEAGAVGVGARDDAWLRGYVRVVREVRKQRGGGVASLRPVLAWAVKQQVPGVAELSLQHAIQRRDVELLRTVAQCGYDVGRRRDEDGKSVLELAVGGGDMAMVRALHDVRCELGAGDVWAGRGGEEVLLAAAADKHPDPAFLLKLMQCGVSINCQDGQHGHTPLLRACRGGNQHKRLVKTLLEQGADVRHRDHEGNSALHVACQRNHHEVVEVLLGAGAEVDAKNKRGITPVLLAAALSKGHVLKLLLQHGAHVNVLDDAGVTPLIAAVKHDRNINVELLVGAGARAAISSQRLLQALRARPMHISAVHSAFTDTDLRGPLGSQYFVLALETRQLTAVKQLLLRGVNPNVTTADGMTPFAVAIHGKYTYIAVALLRHCAQQQTTEQAEQEGTTEDHGTKQDDERRTKEACQERVSGFAPSVHVSVAEELRGCSLSQVAALGNLELMQERLRLGGAQGVTGPEGDRAVHAVILHVRMHSEDVMRCLLAAGADANARNAAGDTPLHLVKGPAMCAVLLQHGARVNATNAHAQTPLHTTLVQHFSLYLKQDAEELRMLVKHGADVLHQDDTGTSPVALCVRHNEHQVLASMLAALPHPPTLLPAALTELVGPALDKGHYKSTRVLVQYGAAPGLVWERVGLHTAICHGLASSELVARRQGEVNEKGRGGVTPLMMACRQGQVDVVQALLEHGATVDDTDDKGDTALFYCKRPDIARPLLHAGADPNHSNHEGRYPTKNAQIPLLQELLQAGADINRQDRSYFTPLLVYAVAKEYQDLLEFLLTNPVQKADPNIVNHAGVSALLHAFPHPHIVRMLLQHNCDPNQQNGYGETLLVRAAQCTDRAHRQRIMDILADCPAVDVEARGEHGRTVLHLALAHKSYLAPLVPFLLQRHARLDTTDAYHRGILHDWQPRTDSLAQLALGEVLRQSVDVNQQDYNGHTPMHLAVLEPDVRLRRIKCRKLLSFGADLSIGDKNGLTAYHLATHDPQLFHSLMQHAPCEFPVASRDLLLNLSRHFQTEASIRAVLRDPHQPPVVPPSEKKANVTFSGAYGLAEWSADMMADIASQGHDNFISHMLHNEVLCSWPGDHMAEMQEKAETVLALFRDISAEVAKHDVMLAFTPFISGSCNEGTKVLAPDEMDMLCVLHGFTGLTFSESPEFPALVTIHQTTPYLPFSRPDDDFMIQSQVFSHFYHAFGRALQSSALWAKYPRLYRLRTDDMSRGNQSITDLTLVWHGKHFPFLEFSVDVVPAFNGGAWLPKDSRDHPLLHRNGVLVIPKFRIEYIAKADVTELFQLSFERSEADLFHMMPVELKQAYMLAKVIKTKIPKIELLPAGMFVSSYLLKTCTFSLFHDHPEYQQRLEAFLATAGASAALSTPPYDPYPLGLSSEITYWCEQLFLRLHQAMGTRSLPAFFLPAYNLLSHRVYEENYRPQLMARVARTLLQDPEEAEGEAWRGLAGEQPWRIGEVDGGAPLMDVPGSCSCTSYLCTKKHVARK